MCICAAGYNGTLCGSCDTGYIKDSSGKCVIKVCETDAQCVNGTCFGNTCFCKTGYTNNTTTGKCDICDTGYIQDSNNKCVNSCNNVSCENGTCIGTICNCNTGYIKHSTTGKCVVNTPVAQLQTEYKISDLKSRSFGQSVSFSGDGRTLAVGEPFGNGSVSIWVRSETGGWIQESKIVGTDNIGNPRQGTSVSLSYNGDTLAVGADGAENYTSATWIFTRLGGVWTQQQKLVRKEFIGNPRQATSVSLSSDGNTLAIGALGDDIYTGATWIFTRLGGVWTQKAKLVGTESIGNSRQGTYVSLSGDGKTLAVGGPGDNGYKGATWIFILSGVSWTQQNKLVGIGSSEVTSQGTSVSLSGDGNTLAVGAPGDNSDKGATWVWTRSGGVWTQQQKFVGTGSNGRSSQGRSVYLSGDGNTLAVGAPGDNNNMGATWVWTRSGEIWTQKAKLVGTGFIGFSSNQGTSVSLSSDGNTLAVGAPNDNSGVGSTWVFQY